MISEHETDPSWLRAMPKTMRGKQKRTRKSLALTKKHKQTTHEVSTASDAELRAELKETRRLVRRWELGSTLARKLATYISTTKSVRH